MPSDEQQEKAPAKKAPAKGVKMRRGDDTVTAHKPTTVTRLKSEGWEVVK